MRTGKSLKKNLLSNVSVFILNGIIGFWLPPYLIKSLGVSVYGMIPLAAAIIGYASLVTIGINGSLSRFLTIDLANNAEEEANYTFNTALASVSFLLIVLLPLLLIFSLNINKFISVPEGVIKDASMLFVCASIAFVLTSLTAIFNTSAYVKNRLDLVNQVSMISMSTRVVLVLIIFLWISISLTGYGYAILAASLFSSLYSYYLFRRFTPFITINFYKVRLSSLKRLLSMGGWLIVIQIGSILFLQIDLLVINKTLGALEAGRYSVILLWSMMIRQFSSSISGALSPLILNLYAKKEFDKMIMLSKLSVKTLTLFITCIVGVLCIISGDLLKLWINEEMSSLKWLFILVIILLPLNLGVQPLFSLNRAYNKVKVPGIITCIMGIISLSLSVSLVKFTSLGLYGIALAGAIVLTMKNFIFMPLYAANNMKINKLTFFQSSLSSVFLLSVSLVITFIYPALIHIKNWPQLIGHSLFLFLLLTSISYLLLGRNERSMILGIVRQK